MSESVQPFGLSDHRSGEGKNSPRTIRIGDRTQHLRAGPHRYAQDVVDKVADATGINTSIMKSRRNTPEPVRARQIVTAFLVFGSPDYKFTVAKAAKFIERERATVMSGLRTLNGYLLGESDDMRATVRKVADALMANGWRINNVARAMATDEKIMDGLPLTQDMAERIARGAPVRPPKAIAAPPVAVADDYIPKPSYIRNSRGLFLKPVERGADE